MFYCPEHAPKAKGSSKSKPKLVMDKAPTANPPESKTPAVKERKSTTTDMRTPPSALVRQASRNSKRVAQPAPSTLLTPAQEQPAKATASATITVPPKKALALLANTAPATTSAKMGADKSMSGVFLSLSGLETEHKDTAKRICSEMGIQLETGVTQRTTHVISGLVEGRIVKRTHKFIKAVLMGKWILTLDWLKACHEQQQKVDEASYEVVGDASQGVRGGPSRGRALVSSGKKLLAGYKVLPRLLVVEYRDDRFPFADKRVNDVTHCIPVLSVSPLCLTADCLECFIYSPTCHFRRPHARGWCRISQGKLSFSAREKYGSYSRTAIRYNDQ